MKKEWEEGKLYAKSGSEHSQWKGGTSSITQRIRDNNKIYKEWKYPILLRDNFQCQMCYKIAGKDKVKLAVHHDKELFCEIIHKFIPEVKVELTWEEETKIVDEIVIYHIENNVSGITLCYGCHKLIHKSNNMKDNDY